MGGPSFAREDLNMGERLLAVFHAPRRSFEGVEGRESAHDWLVPALLVCTVGLATHYLTLDSVTDLASPAVQEQMQALGEEEREKYRQSVEMFRQHGWMMVPVGLFTSLAVVGAVMLALARWGFGTEVSYRQMLVVKAYASLVMIPEWLVRTPLMLVSGEGGRAHTGLGLLVSGEMAGTFWGRLLIAVDFFELWQIGIMGVGLAVMAGVPVRRSALALLLLWALWSIGGAAVETLGPGPAAPGAGS